MLILNKPFPPYIVPVFKNLGVCRLCGSAHTVNMTTPQRVRYQSGWEYTYEVCSPCVEAHKSNNEQTGVDTLKTSYNTLVERITAATEILEKKLYPENEKERYLQAYKILVDQITNILRQLRDHGVKPSENEIENGFKIEQGVTENE